MSTSPLMWLRIFSSTMAGGGVLGEAIGIARGVIMQVGPTIETSRPFTGGYIRVGGMITGNIDGRVTPGIINEFHTSNSSRTGEVGNRTGIGSGSSIGVFLVCAPSRSPNSSGRNSQEMSGRSNHRSTEIVREGKVFSRDEDRERNNRLRCKHNSTSRKQGRSGRGVHTNSMADLKMEKRHNSGEARLPEV